MSKQLNLNGFEFQALFHADGLAQLDQAFLDFLISEDATLCARLQSFRTEEYFSPTEHSDLLLSLAPYLEAYLSSLFDIVDSIEALKLRILSQDPIFIFKQYFVTRQAKRALKNADTLPDFAALDQSLNAALKAAGFEGEDRELLIAQYANHLLENDQATQAAQDQLTAWCVQALLTPEGQSAVCDWVSFKRPKKLEVAHLVPVTPVPEDPIGRLQGPPGTHRERDGFGLTDSRMSQRDALGEIHYCVYCHRSDGDFCSKGFPVKKTSSELGLKSNALGEVLTGCPLEEKISEMQCVKKAGLSLAALAIVMADNPMCPATGHRICNDCMKSCIYQKQTPVNIPEVETRVLTDVLALPWGVEIYDLLTRWNPLRKAQYVMKPYNGLKVLVMGMGPAGFTMAHHLLMEGFAVVGADGLKIEPLPEALMNQPIYDYHALEENLEDRVMSGFGGVAEYGITVRWDKNFLKLIYITLARRPYFQVFGGVRFGGTLSVEDAWRLGFDHLTIAVGAGLPRELAIPNSLAPGMRQANDFLMALQLTGAAKASSLANLQVRLPAVVIGGGLTGVDTATEVQAYYLKQVEKTLLRYERLSHALGEEVLRKRFSLSELEILDEFLGHGRLLREERALAKSEGRSPKLLALLRDWGGVTIVYRRSMQESPAYQRNYEELTKALEEGIYYAEGLSPTEVILDGAGYCDGLLCQTRIQNEAGEWMDSDESHLLPARAIFVATGAKPNVAYAFEHPQDIRRERFEYPRFAETAGELERIEAVGHVKMPHFGAFTSYQKAHHLVSFIGDTHPVFHGSVVKAIASAKRSYPKIVAALSQQTGVGDPQEYMEFRQQIANLFSAKVVSVNHLSRDTLELIVYAPQAAENFQPGQFYRIQNFERYAAMQKDTVLQTEALAMMGFRRTEDPDTLGFLVVKRGASSRLVGYFQPGDPISVMGPTGVRAKIPEDPKTIMVIGGIDAVAYLLSVGPALQQAGHRIVFVGYFPNSDAIVLQARLTALCDVALWIVAEGESPEKLRETDCTYQGDLISAMRAYAQDQNVLIPFSAVDQVDVVGYASLLRVIQKARATLLAPYFREDTVFKASVLGPMQCMLKGVCAQCLQWQIDPETGKRTKAVYACSWQHQPMEIIDISNLDERLSQNSVQEKLTNAWLSLVTG